MDSDNNSKATLLMWDDQEVICGTQYDRNLLN